MSNNQINPDLRPSLNIQARSCSNKKPSTSHFVSSSSPSLSLCLRPPPAIPALAAALRFMAFVADASAEVKNKLPNPQRILHTGLGLLGAKALHSAIYIACYERPPEPFAPLSGAKPASRTPTTSSDNRSCTGFLTRQRRRLREHPQDGSLPRPRQASYCGRISRWPTIPYPLSHLPRRYRTGMPQKRKLKAVRVFETI